MAQNNQACPGPVDDMSIFGAKFVFKPNFEGREERFNEAGDRYFNVRVPDNIVEQVTADGWNVKWTKPKNEEYQPEPFIEVAIGWKYRPPTIVIIQDGRQTPLSEETAKFVDTLEFENMDIVIRGRQWSNDMGGCGIKAWLKTFYGTVAMDDVQRKYAQMREGAAE